MIFDCFCLQFLVAEQNHVKEFLMDTCLTAQDNYKAILEYFEIGFEKNRLKYQYKENYNFNQIKKGPKK